MPTALIVDDEPEANRLLSMLVTLRGYKTTSAFTGGEALDRIDRNPPDVILLDLMLPDINGFEVCEVVKANKSTTLIPVVMVTARVAAENRIESYSRGADHYVAKPYTPDELFEALDDAEDWRRRVRNLDETTGGEIPFVTSDEDETFRKLARLRSVLFAKTPLDIEGVRDFDDALRTLVTDAEAWGKANHATEIASLTYEFKTDSVVITLRDTAGWIRNDPRPPSQRWPELTGSSRFDVIEEIREEGILTLVKHFKGS